jgi:non-specific riboncleoside hydrolase
MKPVILDVDTGIDDAMAIMLACFSKCLDIKFFCSSNGNTSALQGAKNTLNVLGWLNFNYDVVVGSKTGFERTRINRKAHGKTGLGNAKIPKPSQELCSENYLDRYVSELENAKKPIIILVLGPMTNIAKVLKQRPHLSKKIKEIVFMGGSLDKVEGETPYASFNVACDPEALEFVLKHNIKILFVPNNLGRKCFLNQDDITCVKNTSVFGSVLGQIFEGYDDHFVKNGVPMYDPAAVFALVKRHKCKIKKAFMDVKHFPLLDTALAIPHLDHNTPNAKIVVDIKEKTMKKWFFKMLNKTK